MGYHLRKIEKGVYGEPSKIREEFEEFEEALEQGNHIMALVELSDLLGAIEAYTDKHHHIRLRELIVMKEATNRAFSDGSRTSNDPEQADAAEGKRTPVASRGRPGA